MLPNSARDGRNPSCGDMGGARGGMGGMPAGGAFIRGGWPTPVTPAGGTAVGGALVGGAVALGSIVCGGTLYPQLSGVYLQA